MKVKRTYWAIYQIGKEQREIRNINHMPIIDGIVHVPDNSNQYGRVISVGKEIKKESK